VRRAKASRLDRPAVRPFSQSIFQTIFIPLTINSGALDEANKSGSPDSPTTTFAEYVYAVFDEASTMQMDQLEHPR
jgi:hypothetical protein